MPIIGVKHNIEVAHRLFELPGKCEQIHGHSMWVTLFLQGQLNSHGILGGIDFGVLKKQFREHLDREYDHRVLLNAQDPFAQNLMAQKRNDQGEYIGEFDELGSLPGLNATPGDPTTENIAAWIHNWTLTESLPVDHVEVWETSVNFASTARY